LSSQRHRSGGKCGGNHTTLIDAACPFVDFIESESSVKKFSLGRIVSAYSANSRRKITIRNETAGFRCTVRGKLYSQELWVYSTEEISRLELKAILKKGVEKLGFAVVLR
jgi:transcriptional regulator NrdR family protein